MDETEFAEMMVKLRKLDLDMAAKLMAFHIEIAKKQESQLTQIQELKRQLQISELKRRHIPTDETNN